MHSFGELSAQRKQLGAALRRLRANASMSGEQIAARLGISQSRVSRIELGQQAVAPGAVELWAKAADATGADLASLIELAEAAATQAVAWGKRGLASIQHDSQNLEASATTIRNFHPMLVPGLLQVPEYSRIVFAAGNPPGRADIPAAVAARMDRQVILYDQSKHIEFVITEAALRWRIGPTSVMRSQLDRIHTVAALENVVVGVIPQDSETGVWHEHAFNIFDDRGDAGGPVVHVETLASGLTVTDPADVDSYQTVFRQLRQVAATGADARALIRHLDAELAGGE